MRNAIKKLIGLFDYKRTLTMIQVLNNIFSLSHSTTYSHKILYNHINLERSVIYAFFIIQFTFLFAQLEF